MPSAHVFRQFISSKPITEPSEGEAELPNKNKVHKKGFESFFRENLLNVSHQATLPLLLTFVSRLLLIVSIKTPITFHRTYIGTYRSKGLWSMN